jgi:hypothetical protein
MRSQFRLLQLIFWTIGAAFLCNSFAMLRSGSIGLFVVFGELTFLVLILAELLFNRPPSAFFILVMLIGMLMLVGFLLPPVGM